MNKFDMNQMRKQVEAMHRLKAEAQAVEHIGESFDALEAEIGEVAELLEELGDALITVSEMLTGILSEGSDEIDENEENDAEDDCDCCECCQCPFQALMDAAFYIGRQWEGVTVPSRHSWMPLTARSTSSA